MRSPTFVGIPMTLDRRSFIAAASAIVACPALGRASTVTDGAGRVVAVPRSVERVFPAGPPAAIVLYTLAPDTLLGWPRANRAEELAYLDPLIGSRPEVGRLTGRGNTTNLETLLQMRPDLIVDVGSVARTFVETADRIQAQTGLPYALLDGRFDRIAESYRLQGTLAALGAPASLLHERTLGELYGVGVETVEAPDGRRAFLPG